MKTKQTKIDRSAAKWLPGAMALAATTASSQAATVQITLTGNKISTTGGNQLVADLTGDLVTDVTFVSPNVGASGVTVDVFFPGIGGGGGVVKANYWPGSQYFTARAIVLAGVGSGDNSEYRTATSASYLNPITFSDARINGGAPTGGWLQVNAFNTSATDHTVELSRLIFDDAFTARPFFAAIPGAQAEFSAVPEPSSLGLLALGAGGLVFRRRRAKAA